MRRAASVLSWLVVMLLWNLRGPAAGQAVFINELHYDNAGIDQGEGVEVAGVAGTDLSGFRLVFYNGNGGAVYDQVVLSGVIDDEGEGGGARWFAVAGIQNGAPDGVALVEPGGQVVEFWSYEGRMVVAGAGESIDLGVAEGGTTPVGHSLQRTGEGRDGSDFAWVAPRTASPGRLNDGQVLRGEIGAKLAFALGEGEVVEGEATDIEVVATPPTALWLDLVAKDPGEVGVPRRVLLGPDGRAVVRVTGIADGETDGDRRVVLTLRDREGVFGNTTGELVVRDVDTPDLRAGAFRVATCNLKNGAGAPGTAKHEALREILSRVDADVIAFQEASDRDGFGDLKGLVASLGFGTGRNFFATAGDPFAAQAFDGGDFGDGQHLALASRFPIVETVQIGRGEPGREHARFPLYVKIDVPGVDGADDPHVVVVHYKAGSSRADRFRKSVEAFRTTEFLRGRSLDGRLSNVVVMGDFNEDIEDFQPAAFDTGINPTTHTFSDRSTLPATYELGADLTGDGARSLQYSVFPRTAFRGVGVADFPAVQVDGADRTRNDFSPRRLDYILVPGRSDNLGNLWQEVYNSGLEAVSPGLPKQNAPARPGSSGTASDHQVVFCDLELTAKPALAVEVSPGVGREEAGTPVEVVVRRQDGGGAEQVMLVVRPPGEIELERSVVQFGDGEIEMRIGGTVMADGRADPDVSVVIAAIADGHSTGYATMTVRNREAAGGVLVSQYNEPVSGGSLRAIELVNVSGAVLRFVETPVALRQFTNGSLVPSTRAVVDEGVLRDGGVVVIGDGAVGDVLVAAGVIADPGDGWEAFFPGTVFLGANGDAAFQLQPLAFSGDDAIEVLLGQVRADVFGRIGEDPGAGWEGAGVSTSGQNLERLPWSTGGSRGWSDPSLLFREVVGGAPLSGFGEPPAIERRYRDWATAFGVGGMYSDDDGDGRCNLLEYAMLTAPNDASDAGVTEIDFDGGSVVVGMRRRAGVEQLRYFVERSVGGEPWSEAVVENETVIPDGVDGELVLWTLSGDGGGLVRVRIESW